MTTTALVLNPARRAILLVTTLLAMPFIVAFGLYWFDWRPTKLGNHGELIQPTLKLPETGLSLADGRPLPTAELRGKWTLVLISKGACDAACQEHLQQMRQVQVSLNKEMVRLHRVLLGDSVSTLAADTSLPVLRQRYPDLIIAAPATGKDADQWRSALDGTNHRFYVIDPLGNVMMSYTDQPDMQGMRKDLERLLKYSWVG